MQSSTLQLNFTYYVTYNKSCEIVRLFTRREVQCRFYITSIKLDSCLTACANWKLLGAYIHTCNNDVYALQCEIKNHAVSAFICARVDRVVL
jgi:hypothetical protein